MKNTLLTATVSAIPDSVRALAAADFSGLAQAFSVAGFTVSQPGPGMLQIISRSAPAARMSVLLSVGIHGDETGPIEMLAHLLDELAAAPQQLGVDLMIVVGNPAAIAQQRRFIEADLNRLFSDKRGALQSVAEAVRADAIMHATAAFFARSAAPKWHLDLHTAIRPSHYPTFAIVPESTIEAGKQALSLTLSLSLTHWLAHAGVEAEVFSPQSANTYSSFSARECATVSATVELGQIGALGQNDASLLAQPQAALAALLRADPLVLSASAAVRLPRRFKVAQEIIKRSADFRMGCDRNTHNFTSMRQGEIIASDGESVYRVQQAQEYIIFPNPDVGVGLRAGLMLVRQD
ncbi:MAG: succinylglutamate desuccinylase [Glaciimonas sp.]|nr:succinylglutamate desuccinylase [Glaciimonas sp.]